MSPQPPEKGEGPVSGNAGSPDGNTRSNDGSPRSVDVEEADAHVGTGEAQQEEESFVTTRFEPPPNRLRARARLPRFLSRPFSGRQDDDKDELPLKKDPGSAVQGQSDGRHPVQLPSTDLHPDAPETPSSAQLPTKRKKMKMKTVPRSAPRSDELADATAAISPGALFNAEAEGKYRGSEPQVLKGFGFGMHKRQLSSEISMELKAKESIDPFGSSGKPSPSLVKASHSSISKPMSGEDFDDSSPGVENEVHQEIEDPSKDYQRIMVDRVMSTFMNWLDTKLKVKREDESPESESQLMMVASRGSASEDDVSDVDECPASVAPVSMPRVYVLRPAAKSSNRCGLQIGLVSTIAAAAAAAAAVTTSTRSTESHP
ncbi:uncharacterized protein ColSpa_09881 [Colletotrichum spaethianum]|uniref:Uncharacterized protein n=1 Tax=Colletotrichum spaethianum TaxID=700344 RepID=A0AA37PCF5_9PEZI|nr:uncharacterized protein ColSpa_09881 [Colletotrichum spaethianum]GKT49700.1 hypothetical protein ColSpa_09881 [Colletotrichum spaethianum]